MEMCSGGALAASLRTAHSWWDTVARAEGNTRERSRRGTYGAVQQVTA